MLVINELEKSKKKNLHSSRRVRRVSSPAAVVVGAKLWCGKSDTKYTEILKESVNTRGKSW
jgi:hypothetical protein